ncbi:G-protein coupled receptor family C group 6 member A-like [Conger conger]|uniref:G-protein coupled receptor family C group 6 member A-like n=1 Tax=Conger conger TaxID=82655 RepID=UPI002A5A6E97|nr:G-protein coupled receptor family C group 6 member A-like [Conger conger]
MKNMWSFILLLIIHLPRISSAYPCSVLGGPRGVCRTGNVIVGGLFSLHHRVTEINGTTDVCEGFDIQSFLQTRVMIYSIGVINQSPLLPNLTLGYEMYDTCGDVTMALKAALSLMADRINPGEVCLSLGNEQNASESSVKVVVGERHSEISIAVARLLALPLIPQISFASTSELLSRKAKFPSFLRTVPSDAHQTKAMAKLIETLNWEIVGVIGSEDEYGKYGVERLIDHMSSNVCLDFKEILPSVVSRKEHQNLLNRLMQTVKESTAEVIVIFTKTSNVRIVLEEAIRLGINKTWIAGDSWSTATEIRDLKGIEQIGRVYGFIMKQNTVPGFEEHVRGFTAQLAEEDSFFSEYLTRNPACTGSLDPGKDPQNCSFHNADEESSTAHCTNIQCLVQHIDRDESYGIYLAVKVIAQALHSLLKCDDMKCNRTATFTARELLEEIKQVNFTVDNITNISFDQHGDPSLGYDILAWDMEDGGVILKEIGEYAPSGDIVLPQHLISECNNITVTVYNCSKACPYGQELSFHNNTCCKICNFCADNQYSEGGNNTCRSCKDNEFVSPDHDCCVPKTMTFLKLTDGFAIVLAVFGLAGLIFTLLVAVLFIKYRDSPIIKGTGGNLCFLILISLATSFSSVCTFFGRLSDRTCKAGLPLFILSFSLCVSCILANLFQICVGFAFEAKVRDRLKRLNNPVAIVTGCMAVQVALCTMWLTLFPPFRKTVPSEHHILIRCDNGSNVMFAVSLGYISFLAVVCFLFGFKGKRLPDLYKNASFITISMLIYLVAWMLFIPVYIKTSGKYVQAVQASAILVSNYSILGCHFCPKCYIILFRKELNNEKAILEYIRKHYEKKGVSPVTTDK